jgi:hypothetical protein
MALGAAIGWLNTLVGAPGPPAARQMSASPHANGGQLLRALRLPELRKHMVHAPRPRRSHRRNSPRTWPVGCAGNHAGQSPHLSPHWPRRDHPRPTQRSVRDHEVRKIRFLQRENVTTCYRADLAHPLCCLRRMRRSDDRTGRSARSFAGVQDATRSAPGVRWQDVGTVD